MGHKKASKGEISVTEYNGRIRLRWRYNGVRYSLNLPFAYLKENLPLARTKSAEIKLDILKGCFDATLEKYKGVSSTETKQINTPAPKVEVAHKPEPINSRLELSLNSLVTDFEYWTKNIRNIELDKSIDYITVRNMLEKWVIIPVSRTAELLNARNWKAATYNKRLKCLCDFFDWLVLKGILLINPLKGVVRKRNKKTIRNPKRIPLSEDDILKLLNAIKNDTYCPAASQFKHSHYYPFLYFMFLTGVRNAEAIGLRVKHIDLANNQIEISETFARSLKGSNHAARVNKGTKMDNVRYLPLSEELLGLLTPLMSNKTSDSFVFQSPKGLSIDDRMLQRRILRPVLKELGLEKKDLYVARHSFGTRAAQQGMAITDIAYLMGHTTIETAIRNYITVTKTNASLPQLGIKENNK